MRNTLVLLVVVLPFKMGSIPAAWEWTEDDHMGPAGAHLFRETTGHL